MEASETRTWKSPLFHEVTHELWLCEEDVIKLVHTEIVDLVDVLPAIQILMESLYFTYTVESDKDKVTISDDFLFAFTSCSKLQYIILL